MRALIIGAVVLVATAHVKGALPDKCTPGFEVEVFVSGKEGYHSYRIPALVSTPSGTLLAFCEGRKLSQADHGWNDIVMKSSTDHGRSWSPLKVVYGESHGSTLVTIGNPAPVLLSDNTLLLSMCRNNIDVLTINSTDFGKTCMRDISSQVVPSTWSWVATGPPGALQLKSGRIVVPTDHYLKTDHDAWFSHMILSDDGGHTWNLSANINGGNECQAAELPDGTVFLSMRTKNNHRQQAWSSDGGSTWSAPSSTGAQTEVECEASLMALPNGEGLALSSADSTKGRENMDVQLSTDGGHTWGVWCDVYSGSAAYSSLQVVNSTALGLLYEKNDYGSIVYTPVAW